jgi:hypothetical protein
MFPLLDDYRMIRYSCHVVLSLCGQVAEGEAAQISVLGVFGGPVPKTSAIIRLSKVPKTKVCHFSGLKPGKMRA